MALDSEGKIASLVRSLIATSRDRMPSQIEEGLFLGSRGAAMNLSELKRLNITHILTLTGSIRPTYPDDFKYKVIQVDDKNDTDLAMYFSECFEFINEAKMKGGGVLVHCYMGRSRSATVVAAYMMKKHGLSDSEALNHVRSKRPQAAPNSGFIKQLREFGQSLLDARNALIANSQDEAVTQQAQVNQNLIEF